MRIERRYTKTGQSPYSSLAFRLATSEIRNPDGSVVFKLENIEVPETWSQVASDVLAQKYFRKAGVPARLKKVEENDVPSWLWRSVPDEAALADPCPRTSASAPRSPPSRFSTAWPAAGPIGAGRAATSPPRRMPRPSTTSCASCSPTRWWRRTRRNGSTPACTGPTASTVPSQGHYLRGLQDRQADQVQVVLRAPAAACLLHPGRRGRPGERGRHHGPVGARGAPVQVRLRHRLQLLQAARRGREALRRRPLVRPHELPQDRRPGRRRDQVGRHHAPRRQDGRGRRRSPGHREPTSTGR